MIKAIDPNSNLANFSLLGGLFAALYIIVTIIMAFFRPWLLNLELVIQAGFKHRAKEESVPGYDPKDLSMQQLEKVALKTIKHR